jgi:hypothetical protein
MEQHEQKDMRAWVGFQTYADGTVLIIATGRNGTLALKIDGGEKGPSMNILDLDSQDPRKLYKGIWGLEANGQLRGWIVDDNGKIKWFPERTERKPRKRPAKGRQATKSVKKEG